jgi:predicted house-cleaning noncanonical NTP pyrophosphatase (MazG superfamily)
MQLKVENYPDLIRDSKSRAIINVNRNAMVEHMSKQQMKESIQNLNEEMVSLKNDFREIKALLQQIANRG